MTDQEMSGSGRDQYFHGNDQLAVEFADRIKTFKWPSNYASDFINQIRQGKVGNDLISVDDRRRLEGDNLKSAMLPFRKLILLLDSSLSHKIYLSLCESGWAQEDAQQFTTEVVGDQIWPAVLKERRTIARQQDLLKAVWKLAEHIFHQQREIVHAVVGETLFKHLVKETREELLRQSLQTLTEKQQLVVDLFLQCKVTDWALHLASDPLCPYFPPQKAESQGTTLVLTQSEIKRRQNSLRVALSRALARVFAELRKRLKDNGGDNLSDLS